MSVQIPFLFPTSENKYFVHCLICLVHHFSTSETNKENFPTGSVVLDYNFLTSPVLHNIHDMQKESPNCLFTNCTRPVTSVRGILLTAVHVALQRLAEVMCRADAGYPEGNQSSLCSGLQPGFPAAPAHMLLY